MKRMLTVVLALMLSAFGAPAQDASDMFNRAVHLQDVKGDLEAAIPLFQKVVTGTTDAPLAAKAQLRMAMCYEKLGREEAYDAYQKVIRDFATQADLVGTAKEKLSRLKRPTTAAQATKGLTLTKVYTGKTYATALSPDRKRLTLVRSELSSRDLWTRDVRTGKELRLTTLVTVSADEAWAPDSRWIAFADRDREIKIVSVDGGPVRTLFTLDPKDTNTAGIAPTGWTSDSRKVVYQIPSKGLFAVAAAGGAPEPILTYENPDEARRHENMTLSPDGRWIAYGLTLNGNADLYVVPVAGQSPVRVTATPAAERKPRWSPDGRWLAYTSTGTENPQIWAIRISPKGEPEGAPVQIARDAKAVRAEWIGGSSVGIAATFKIEHLFTANTDGTGEIPLSQFDAFNARPAWSPNGDTIAFRSDYRKPMNRYQLWTVPSTGGTPRLASDKEVSGFVWSGDGERLLFQTNSGRSIMEVPARGGEATDITPKGKVTADGPSFWPNGRRQCSAYAVDPPKYATADDYLKERMSGISVVLVPGGEPRTLIPADTKGVWYSICRVSPDGRRIAYILFDYAKYEKEGMYSIWTMDAEGGSRTQIALGGEYVLDWSPDGKWIVFEKRVKDMDFELYKVAADGGQPIRMNITGRSPEFSPDGKRIAFGRSIDYGYEYWLVENALPAQAGKTK